jgi:energy-converting hydrogenase A subunit R
LFEYLHKKKIPTYIISTSYTQHAFTITRKLNHPIENVRCTTLDFSLKPESADILGKLFDDIFPRYLKSGLDEVKDELDEYFFKEIPKSVFSPVFNSTIVCGGGRKREAVIELLECHDLSPKDAFAVGDSITDIQMLDYVNKNGGAAISFNGNEHSLRPANIAYSGRSIFPLRRLLKVFPDTLNYLSKVTKEDKELAAKNEEFIDLTTNISEEEFQRILTLQKKYRKMLREKAAQLT